MPNYYPIIAFVGSSGSGKTTLITELFKRHPNYINPLKSLTSRPKRGPEDDIFYTFVAEQEIIDRQAHGDLVQYLEYAGNTYGTDRHDIEDVIQHKLAAQAYVENGVLNLRKAGYKVIPIKIVASNAPEENINRGNDQERAQEDQNRSQIELDYALTVVNDFTPGGLEKALKKLEEFLHETLAKTISNRLADRLKEKES